jgi:oligopeptide transport system permease protein
VKKAAGLFLVILLTGTLWSLFYPESGADSQVDLILQGPSKGSWLGKDSLGRDLLSRVFQGAQVSVGLGLASAFMSLFIGVLYGTVAATGGRRGDAILMRFAEVLMSLPSMMLMAVLALILQTRFFENKMAVLFWALSLSTWMVVAKLTRNLILKEKVREYVEAARALGASDLRIFWRHLIPNMLSPLLVYWSLQIPQAILAEGLLSFLGFGVKSPGTSWGILLQEGWKTMSLYPHLILGPALFLFLTVLSINVLLEDFRQRLDPRLKWDRLP